MKGEGYGRGLEAATAVALLAVVGVPFLFIILEAIFPEVATGSFAHPFASVMAAFADPDFPKLAWHSLSLGLCVAVASAALGAPLGIARGLMRVRFIGLFDAAFFAPFMIPPYLSTLGWILFLQPRGYLDRAIHISGGRFLFSFWGAVFVMTLNLFPIVYFAVARATEAAGGRLTNVARLFGASPPRAFIRVMAPLAVPAILSSVLLVFSAAIEEFGTPAALAGQSGFLVLVTGIDRKVSDWPIDLSGASNLSLVLSAMALAAFLLQERALRSKSFETIGGKPRESEKYRLTWRSAPILAIFALVVLTSVGAPLFSIMSMALMRTASGGLGLDNLSLHNFSLILTDADGALEAMGVSLALATATAIATAIIGAGAALCIARPRVGGKVFRGLVGALTVAPNAAPGVVVAVGLILAWNQPALPVTVYGSWIMLVLAYSCILLPYPTRYASAALRQIGSSLEAAARLSGAGRWTTLRRITLPLLAPSLISAMTLVFAISSRELVASTLLAPVGGQTIATFIWRQFEQGSLGEGMAMSVVAIVIAAAALGILRLLTRIGGSNASERAR